MFVSAEEALDRWLPELVHGVLKLYPVGFQIKHKNGVLVFVDRLETDDYRFWDLAIFLSFRNDIKTSVVDIEFVDPLYHELWIFDVFWVELDQKVPKLLFQLVGQNIETSVVIKNGLDVLNIEFCLQADFTFC